MLKQNKIAVFFDCENISAKYLQGIFDTLSSYGEVMIAKAYCDWSNAINNAWRDSLHKYAIEAVFVQPNTAYKNAADIRMVIDVMKTTCTSKVDTIAIVSSDSDFTALAIEVKANNFEVIGIGEKKTPESLRNAYSTFIQLPSRTIKKQNNNAAVNEIKKIISEHHDQDGFMKVSQIGIYLNNNSLFESSNNYGAKTWGDFIKMNSELFISKSVGRSKSTLMVKCVA